ncbi:type II toxin-antitoxin system YafQ family toxin [uncultured Thiothrix sp.]|jgi:mRNA interferase YafQ|uniref:type II toxin-antitoxin system YafQ family toxin n=1 Tax=uncultured Thiothrix sp. TaxID=223185 RepID=UPI00261C7718|nr:type II toxin-antitoxin system YafQ family toxin [uncultured Thiothrix sp.]
MRKFKPSKAFKRDINKIGISEPLVEVLYLLANDQALPEKYRDHALSGDLQGFRECHVKPDLLLIYQQVDEVLELVRLGSHSELF